MDNTRAEEKHQMSGEQHHIPTLLAYKISCSSGIPECQPKNGNHF